MKQRVGYLVPQFPGQTHGFFWREVLELRSRGVEPILLSTTPPHQGLISHVWSEKAIEETTYLATRSPMALALSLLAFPYVRVVRETMSMSAGDRLEFLRDVAICAPAAWRLKQTCGKVGVGHVHVHSCGRAALIAALAHHMYGLPYSLTLHGHPGDYGVGQRFKWRGAKFVSVISRALLPYLPDLLGDAMPARLPVRSMGVDTAGFCRDTPYQPVARGETLQLFCCGRLNLGKGHQDLLAAVRMLLDEGRSVKLEIAGEDDSGGRGYRLVLERLVAEMGLTDHVRLLGAVSADHVRSCLLNAHAFVLASLYEGIGVAYMEAMSCEVPTIATATGGVPELITDGIDGLLVSPSDPAALAQAIARIADDPQLARDLSVAGRKRVVEAFDSRLGAEMLIEEIWGKPARSMA